MLINQRFKGSLSGFAGIMPGLVALLLCITQSSCGDGNSGTTTGTPSVFTQVDTASGGGLLLPVLSGNVPSEVALPPNPSSNPEDNRPFFDHFSWQSFIALCWPVTSGQRGVPIEPNNPQVFLKMTNATPVVWTSYKNQWDLFGQGDSIPSPWNSWDDAVSLCQTGQKINHIFGTAKSDMLPGEGNESFSVPLVDQYKNYALFEIRYNEPQYNFIVNNGLYKAGTLYQYQKDHGGAVTMPTSTKTTEGSILVKAAWRSLDPAVDDLSRYYILNELVYNPVTGECSKQLVGLVGLHIAQKVDTFPQWIWSSFEQVDNIPGAPNAKAPYSFNNGKAFPATKGGYANKPGSTNLIADKNKRVPVQVTRVNEIPVTPAGNSTVDINTQYQKLVGSTWMQYYQLVITQWPTNPAVFKQYSLNGHYPGDCGQPFPENNCANTTMETYYQSAGDAAGVGGNSCMKCHYTAPNTDFSWSLQLRSH